MSDDCACLYGGFDEYDEEGFAHIHSRTARKPHVCVECRKEIQPRSRYEHYVQRYDGEFSTQRTCAVCAEIRKALYCDGWYFGQLWEDVREQLFPKFSIACVEKLQTLEAKAELTRRYRDFLGLDF